MKIIKAIFQYTKHVRNQTCGGMDSEYSHSEFDVGTRLYVVPDGRPIWKLHVRVEVEMGHTHDKSFKILSIEDGEEIYGIIRSVEGRI